MTDLNIENCIIEGEIVPLDDKDNLMDFQSLLSRKQNYERLYVFDLLMLNNKSYMEEGLPSRRDTLFSNILDKITGNERKKFQPVEFKMF